MKTNTASIALIFLLFFGTAYCFSGSSPEGYSIKGTIARGSHYAEDDGYDLRFFTTDQPCSTISDAGYELFLCYYFQRFGEIGENEPLADCTVFPQQGTPGETIFYYNAGGSINADEFQWDWFGDSSEVTPWSAQNFQQKTWAMEGIYESVLLTVRNNASGKTDSVYCPRVTASFLPPEVNLPEEINYREGESRDMNLMEFVSDPDTDIWELSWNENSFPAGQIIVSYSVPWNGIVTISGGLIGSYKLMFTAIDPQGKSGIDSMKVKVRNPTNPISSPPTAVCSVLPVDMAEKGINDPWILDPSGSTDNPPMPDPQKNLIVRWDAGNDGSWEYVYPDARINQEHRFASLGIHEIKLEIEDSWGMKGETVCSVEVSEGGAGAGDVLNIKKLVVNPKFANPSTPVVEATATIENVTPRNVTGQVMFWATDTSNNLLGWTVTTPETMIPANSEVQITAQMIDYTDWGFIPGESHWIYAEIKETDPTIEETDERQNMKRDLFTLLASFREFSIPETNYLAIALLVAVISLILLKK